MVNVFNVCDFGAVGDGVTDDTLAIKSAFNKLNDANRRTQDLIKRIEWKQENNFKLTRKERAFVYCAFGLGNGSLVALLLLCHSKRSCQRGRSDR